jgi:hypothetical protein
MGRLGLNINGIDQGQPNGTANFPGAKNRLYGMGCENRREGEPINLNVSLPVLTGKPAGATQHAQGMLLPSHDFEQELVLACPAGLLLLLEKHPGWETRTLNFSA